MINIFPGTSTGDLTPSLCSGPPSFDLIFPEAEHKDRDVLLLLHVFIASSANQKMKLSFFHQVISHFFHYEPLLEPIFTQLCQKKTS